MEKTCPITKILSYLSKKWTLLILRELHNNGTKRFNDLIREMENISPRTLSKRLKELEKLELVSRKRFNEIPPRVEYSLNNKGKELIKCFKHLDIWARKFDAR
ncbi:helix-turn-helix transcriptional regulator [Candidatus Pacearchaeota archaeon]|nr:helix-turn-helix transcriptional regulator [Candidatus Pacearchaeota archaeon]